MLPSSCVVRHLLPSETVWHRLIGRVRFVVSEPVLSSAMYLSVLLRTRARLENVSKIYGVQRIYEAQKSTLSTVGFAIIDEGPMHAFYSALFGTRPTKLSKRFLELVVRRLMGGHTFVLIEASKECCISRFRARTAESSRFNIATSSQVVALFLEDTAYDEIVSVMSRINADALRRFANTQSAFAYLRSFVAGCP